MPELQSPNDLPPVVGIERRRCRDRRGFWRGGRRNTDWVNRPIGGWRYLERLAAMRNWLAKLPLPGTAASTAR